MSYVDPEQEVRPRDKSSTPPIAPERDPNEVVARVDQVNDELPPWTRPVDIDYSWDPAARPTIPAEGSQVELGAVA